IFSDLLHPRERGVAREIDAPLLNNALPLDDFIVVFLRGVKEAVIVL
ncbi:hypothetical protein A2U01_0093312, partial [Trifolium medium]|nr:hypothetical protein [Trifolium medium]